MSKRLFILILALLAAAGCADRVSGQWPAPAPTQAVPLRSAADLEQLLRPIALYPDPLISEILPAATQPTQIVVADRYVSQGADPGQIDVQPWDPSVKALAHYPTVLRWLDDNLVWTTQVGQAFLYQEGDVMDAIQRLRAEAMALGNLQSNPEQNVIVDNGLIEIVPANPQVVYVPVYQPDLVYVQAAPQPDVYFSYGPALAIGPWLNHDFDWRRHEVLEWGRDHPRPADWYHRRDHESSEALRGASVWRPAEHRAWSDRDREARGWSSERGTQTSYAGRQQPSVSGQGNERPSEARTAPPAVRSAPNARTESVAPRTQPGAPVSQPGGSTLPGSRGSAEQRSSAPPVAQRPSWQSSPAPAQPARSSPAATPERHEGPVNRGAAISPPASTGALVGVHSTPETRQYSVRGQESRAGMGAARPVAPPPAVAAPAPTRAAAPPAPARTAPSPPNQERNKR